MARHVRDCARLSSGVRLEATWPDHPSYAGAVRTRTASPPIRIDRCAAHRMRYGSKHFIALENLTPSQSFDGEAFGMALSH